MAKMTAGLLIASVFVILELANGVRRDDLIPAAPPAHAEDLTEILESRSPSGRVPPDFFCNSCRRVSNKVERFLNEPSLYKEIEKVSGELCYLMRTDLQVKCRKLMELYLREGILFFQIVFLEKNLCNYTGFCPPSNTTNSSPDEYVEASPARLPFIGEMILSSFLVKGRPVCDACHVAADEIRRGLDDHNQQMRILKALLEACESLPTHADQCKRSIFQYGPIVIGNLHKFLSVNDLCVLLRMCDRTAPPPEVAGRAAESDMPPTLHHLLTAMPR